MSLEIRAGKSVWWNWSYRQVCTQDNAGGGHLIATVTPPAGTTMLPTGCRIVASGNRAVGIYWADADGNIITLAAAAAGAGANVTIPGIGTSPAASGNYPDMTNSLVSSTDYLMFQVTSAGQTETATLSIHMLVNGPTAPTVSWATSGGTPNAAAATNNSITAVVL